MLLAEVTASTLGEITPIISTFFVGIILIVVLSMLKSFITQAISIAVTEWLLKMSDEMSQLKITRWFANGDQIQELLNEINTKLDKKKTK